MVCRRSAAVDDSVRTASALFGPGVHQVDIFTHPGHLQVKTMSKFSSIFKKYNYIHSEGELCGNRAQELPTILIINGDGSLEFVDRIPSQSEAAAARLRIRRLISDSSHTYNRNLQSLDSVRPNTSTHVPINPQGSHCRRWAFWPHYWPYALEEWHTSKNHRENSWPKNRTTWPWAYAPDTRGIRTPRDIRCGSKRCYPCAPNKSVYPRKRRNSCKHPSL
ncbi:hypothetical protein BD779DRAFT_736656 [Infundibulicybe gibba]|nr:hypothetical protein BD779DRAFT_736656 [Infundibulicybe gibba]